MKKCDKYDNWTECEKRGCKGCFYNYNEYTLLELGKYKYIVDLLLKKCRNEIEVAKNGIYIFRDNIVMKRRYETQYIIYTEILEKIIKEVK